MQLAITQGVPIQFDEVALSPYFRYEEASLTYEVWFEDVRSLREKFRLVSEYGLREMGYWTIMQLFRANWLLAADLFFIQ